MKAIAATDQIDDDPGFRFTAYAHLAWSMVVRGDIARAREFLGRVDGLQSEAPFAARLDFAEASIFSNFLSGAIEQSEATFAALCAEIGREDVATTLVARAYHNNAFLHALFGDLSTALARATHAVAISDETLAPAYHLASLGILSAVLVKRGELEGAAKLLVDAERIIANLGHSPTRFTATLASAGIPLGAHTAKPVLVERYGDPAGLEEAFASREYFWISTTALSFVYDAAERGDDRRAREILDRLIDVHSPAPILPELAVFAARFASSDRTVRLVEMMDTWPEITPALRAARALANGFLQRRARRSPTASAEDAAQRSASNASDSRTSRLLLTNSPAIRQARFVYTRHAGTRAMSRACVREPRGPFRAAETLARASATCSRTSCAAARTPRSQPPYT